MSEEQVTFYLEARRGSTRLSTQRVATISMMADYRDPDPLGMYGLIVDALRLELGPYVKQLISDRSQENPNE